MNLIMNYPGGKKNGTPGKVLILNRLPNDLI